jgi:signal transduction histidine kinase
VLGGVCGGLAEHLGVEPLVVRLAFVVLTAASGSGFVLYVLAWLLLPEAEGQRALVLRGPLDRRSATQAASVGLVVLGILLALRPIGVWFDDSVVWPVSLGAAGLAVIWQQAMGQRSRPGGLGPAAADVGSRRLSLLRVVAGMGLVAAGVAVFLAAHGAFAALGPALVATAGIAGGCALAFAPWWWRLGGELAAERRERVRSQERSEVAAHLHDSVLQTLALIQRHAGDAVSVARLARRQEAELRGWLYGTPRPGPEESLWAALEAAAEEVEDLHGATVDVVVVGGDCPLDDGLAALVAAAREAMVNAAKWSGRAALSVFLEVEPERASVFVRDRGAGFDLAAVADDRHGIADSIVGRMARHGGTATIRSATGEGTEVQLDMAREQR